MAKIQIFIVPVSGARVLNPADGKTIVASGQWVERSSYWIRRVREGVVTITEPREV